MSQSTKSFPKFKFIIPVEQQNTRLINAIFDKQTIFKDSLFYDISAWFGFPTNFEGLNSLALAGPNITQR
jgi:hypothetical protein